VVRDTGIGLLLSEFGGSTNGSLVQKSLGDGTVVEPTKVGDHDAYWITGAPHDFFYLDRNGDPQVDTRRLVTGTTLLWSQDGVTFRMESALARGAAVRLAESLQPLK
jgi:hypothetical protein